MSGRKDPCQNCQKWCTTRIEKKSNKNWLKEKWKKSLIDPGRDNLGFAPKRALIVFATFLTNIMVTDGQLENGEPPTDEKMMDATTTSRLKIFWICINLLVVSTTAESTTKVIIVCSVNEFTTCTYHLFHNLSRRQKFVTKTCSKYTKQSSLNSTAKNKDVI